MSSEYSQEIEDFIENDTIENSDDIYVPPENDIADDEDSFTEDELSEDSLEVIQ